MRSRLILTLSLLACPQALMADLEVQAMSGQVIIRARGVPLARILEQLGKETGMKVVYETAAPSQIVNATVEATSEREALTRIMEGLGVGYAFRMDASGTRVEMLLITEAGGGPGSAPGAAPGPGSRFPTRRPVMPEPMEGMEGFDEPIPEVMEFPGEAPPPPFVEAPEGLPPGFPFPPNMPLPDAHQDLPRPEFPGAVSYPPPR